MNKRQLLELYRIMYTAREIDERERVFVSQNLAHFHVSGAGHEATAALAAHLTEFDWLHLHYRDKALLLARGLPIAEFFSSLLGRRESHSAGRQMSAHFSAPHRNVMSLVGPVGNNALQAVGVAAAIKDRSERPIVVCSVGDGTTQEGEFLEAVAEAVRWHLPVLFLIQDNRWSISTPTRGRTFFDHPSGPADEFYGMPIQRFDGTDVVSVAAQFASVVSAIRDSCRPQLVVLEVERLANHTNADDQTKYRESDEINYGRENRDPLVKLRNQLLNSWVSVPELEELECSVKRTVHGAAEGALLESDPVPAFVAKAPFATEFLNKQEYRGNDSGPRLTMREAIGEVLRTRLSSDPRVFLYGQDIEDPKGDVFGVTRGLSTAFRHRVINAPLSESTIVGTSIGRALAGQRPVAFIQFADFLPLAFNQIASELGSMYWRTNGGWQCPVILMVTCGGYKPGLGPFHAQTMDGFAAHIPGLDVVMPSSAADAAGLLNAAFESPRPTIFFYPKSCLNLSDRATSTDVERQFVLPGKALRLSSGTDLTLVTWGNPVAQCEAVASSLSDIGYSVDLHDLRSLSPWDESAVIASVEKTKRLVVVHEDNHTGGFGAEVLATVTERAAFPVHARRITRSDTYVPYHYGNQLEILPSFKRILETCADLLECDVTWQPPPLESSGQETIRAMGSGPADESVEVVAIHVEVGQEVQPGQIVAEIEATKSVVEVCATSAGRVIEINATVGQRLKVGSSLMRIERNSAERSLKQQIKKENSGTPRLARREKQPPPKSQAQNHRSKLVGIAGICCVPGSRVVRNEDLAWHWPQRHPDEIVRLTGIESRHWVGPEETVLSLAVSATRQLLRQHSLTINQIDLVIACTTTPDHVTPSLACRIAAALEPSGEPPTLAAYDINAACSGYLFALSQAWDYLQHYPLARVLIVTSEVLSPLVDINDFDSAILFGDAATATLVVGEGRETPWLNFSRPVISGNPDANSALCVPLRDRGHLTMQGSNVFKQAVRSMSQILRQACDRDGIPLDDLTMVVPHQANQRIIDAIHAQTGCPVLSHIRNSGNTSSSSIPLCLAIHRNELPTGPIGFVCFGGGTTFGSCIAATNLS
ncbi:MAG: 2-oxoisovalerate dehydrogenase [Planctomycetes bacterium]|nr:2-oxoisovalerate dehydrogenase [Planctomycetota bacterium]